MTVDAVELGVRPEHLEAGETPGAVPLQVEMVEPMGSETLVWCRLADDPVSVLLGDDCGLNRVTTAPCDTAVAPAQPVRRGDRHPPLKTIAQARRNRGNDQ